MSTIIENIPSAPSLPPDLIYLYSTLPVDQKRLINKIYMYLWDQVAPASRFVSHGGVLWAFWAVEMLRIKVNLTSSELSVLSYLYQITNKGTKTVKSEIVYNGMLLPGMNSESKITLLNILKRKNFIIRLNRDPSAPYLRRAIARQRVFLQMTPKGVGVIKDIEKGLHKLIFNTSLNEITGVNLQF